MAYIPTKKENGNQEQGMNVLQGGMQQPLQQQQQAAGGPTLGGGQAQTIGGGVNQPQQQQQVSPQQKGSGMYSNIHKYAEANKSQAQGMANAAVDRYAKQAARIRDSINKQRQQFSGQAQAAQSRLQSAGQFGQQALNQAAGQESQEMLNFQQQQLQDRLGRFGTFDQTTYQPQIEQFQQQQAEQQARLDALRQQAEQAGQGFDQGQFTNILSSLAYAPQKVNDMGIPLQDAYGNVIKTYNQGFEGAADFLNTKTQQGYDEARRQYENVLQKQFDKYDAAQRYLSGQSTNPADQAAFQELYKERTRDFTNPFSMETRQIGTGQYELINPEQASQLANFRNLYEQEKGLREAQKLVQTGETELAGTTKQLGQVQEQQRLLENRNRIQQELNDLTTKMENAPEELTQEDIDRFRRLSSGLERFDNLGFDYSQDKQSVDKLTGLSQGIEKEDVRSRVLRNMLGGQAYGGGKAALDDLILQGNEDARRTLLEGIRGEAEGLKGGLKEAQQASKKELGQLYTGTQDLQKALQEGLISKQDALKQMLEQKQQTGEGTLFGRARQALESGQGLSEEDMKLLGLDPAQRLFDLNLEEMLQHKPEEYGISDVANLTDLARANALASLAGTDQNLISNYDDVRKRSLGGLSTAEQKAAEGFQKGISDREAQFQQDLKGIYGDFGAQLGFSGSNVMEENIRQLLERGRVDRGGYSRSFKSLEDLMGRGEYGDFGTRLAMDEVFNDPLYWQERGEFFGKGGDRGFADAYQTALQRYKDMLQKSQEGRAGDLALESTARQDALKDMKRQQLYEMFDPNNPYNKKFSV